MPIREWLKGNLLVPIVSLTPFPQHSIRSSRKSLRRRKCLVIPRLQHVRSLTPRAAAAVSRTDRRLTCKLRLRISRLALGKRFAVAKLTASLSARAKLRPRLLVASGRLIPSPEIQVSTGKDLLIPRGRATWTTKEG
ncbi:hypothetical protein KY290_001270 [Solanum tuberosum]|uniref:Uncharacterized protein n=1 Tax=Solanum tuberosum TaxID=4113 RepID=A0ABQ7WLP1_SOLTU|nr:hypothetical protein KY290_001270 [Solanum tuberosum]